MSLTISDSHTKFGFSLAEIADFSDLCSPKFTVLFLVFPPSIHPYPYVLGYESTEPKQIKRCHCQLNGKNMIEKAKKGTGSPRFLLFHLKLSSCVYISTLDSSALLPLPQLSFLLSLLLLAACRSQIFLFSSFLYVSSSFSNWVLGIHPVGMQKVSLLDLILVTLW